MTDKEELKQAAFSLAMTELRGRLLYDRFRRGLEGATEENLQKIAAEREEECRRVNQIRQSVPGIEGKSYWWDLPYDIKNPPGQFSGSFAMPQGVYSEQDDFSDCCGAEMVRNSHRYLVTDVLASYFSYSDYVVLYADRKRMKAQLTSPVEMKAIICAQEEQPAGQTMEQKEPPPPFIAEQSYDYWYLQKEIKSISEELPGKLEAFEQRRDNFERFVNGSIYTNQERWIRGEMSNDSYYSSELYRDLRRREIEEKSMSQIASMEWKLRQIKKKEREIDSARKRYDFYRVKAGLSRDIVMYLMRCGYAFYLDGNLVGIVIARGPGMVFRIRHRGNISPFDIFGEISEMRGTEYQIPDPGRVLSFIASAYAGEMKPYSILSTRPKNASDELWRYWAELRFAGLLASE